MNRLSGQVVLFVLLGHLAWSAPSVEAPKPSLDKQKAVLKEMLQVLPKDVAWERWLVASGALPPDFETLPSVPFLPDPLRFTNGRDVKREDWPKRRQELLAQFQYWITGSWPLSPGNGRVAGFQQHLAGGAMVHRVLLEFGPKNAAQLHLELILPKGDGPFPVFMTQDTHRHWALVAVSRGYIGCVYAGADSNDDTDAWRALWPEHDWSKLTRRAWAASRCVDYLQTLPFVVTNQIALAGHSRNGKTSLIAAAFDPRINAVISSSSGAGGACSYRLFSETEFGEGIENLTRAFPDWFHPRLRFFAGRENKLPVDQPQLIACIAPRPCLISSALNDGVESIWAIEHSFYSARRSYDLLGRGGDLNLRYRSGGHETKTEDIESYMDWLDSVFGRAEFAFPDCALFPTYSSWLKRTEEKVDPMTFPTNNGLADLLVGAAEAPITTSEGWRSKRGGLRERITWGLGTSPDYAESEPGTYGTETTPMAVLLDRASLPAGLARRRLNFGNYVSADLYYPTNADEGLRLPAVIWLHPVSISHGYTAAYKRGENPHIALARTGCAVLAFDQIGNGRRVEEIKNFYHRYPRWSLLGKQVEDTLAAVEALRQINLINPRQIFLLGYSTGGMTALHAAALDDRIAGVISVAGFTPMRLDTAGKGTGGVGRWAGWLPLQPHLGAFVGNESRIPYDYHEVLAMIAPRPALIFTPKIDWRNTPADVQACVEEARKVYQLLEAKETVQFVELNDYNHFSPETQNVVFNRLKTLFGL